MNKNETTYERPTCNVLVVRFEQSLLQASLYGASGAAGRGFSDGNINDLTGDDDF